MGMVRAFTSHQTSWIWDFIVNAVIIDSFCLTFFFKQQLERLIYCVITKIVLIMSYLVWYTCLQKITSNARSIKMETC